MSEEQIKGDRVQSVNEFEERMRAEGRCACGRPLAKVKNATLCENCRNDILGDLSAA